MWIYKLIVVGVEFHARSLQNILSPNVHFVEGKMKTRV